VRSPNLHFEVESDYIRYLEETEQQLDPDQAFESLVQDEPEDLEVTENYPFAPEAW
jgi:hypothetical protein